MCQVALAVGTGAGWQGWVLGHVRQGWGLPGKMPGTEVDTGQGFPGLDWGCYLGGMAGGGVGTGWKVCWGHLGRRARGPDSFHTTASVLGLRESEFVHKPFKRGVLVSHSSLAFPNVSPTGFQIQLWGLIFLVLVSGLWCPMWGWNSSLLREVLQVCDIHLAFEFPARGMGSPPTHLNEVFFFIFLIVEELFC